MLRKIRHNIVFWTIGRILKLLTKQEKRRGYRLAFITLLGALIDVLGLAFLVPVMMAATNPDFVTENKHMSALYDSLGFETYPAFMMFLAIALLLVFIFKNAIALALNYAHSSYCYSVATSMARRQFIKSYQEGYQYFKATNSADIINNIVNVPAFFASGVLISAINIIGEALVMAFIVIGIAFVDIALFVSVMAVLIPSGILIYNGSKNKLFKLGPVFPRLLHFMQTPPVRSAVDDRIDVPQPGQSTLPSLISLRVKFGGEN